MTFPTECNMQDLSDLKMDAMATSILQAFLPSSDDRKMRLYQHIFARLVDKGIYEYQLAREHLVKQVMESKRPYEELVRGRIIYMDGFTNHLENCINAVGRLLRLRDKLLSQQLDPPIPKTLRKVLQASSSTLVDVRNTMEHMDDVIRRDELEEGEVGILSLGKDQASAVIGGYSISFRDLETTLRKLHEIAHLRFKPMQSSSATEDA